MWAEVLRLAREGATPWEFTPGSYETLILRHLDDGFEVQASYHPWAPYRQGAGEIRHLLDLGKFPEGLRLSDAEFEACRPWTRQQFYQSQERVLSKGEVRAPVNVHCRCDVSTPHGADLIGRMAPWFVRSAEDIRNILLTVAELRGL